MKQLIKKCYFNTFKTYPSETLLEDMIKNAPSYLSFLVKRYGVDYQETKEIAFLFVHSNYKPTN